MSLLNKKYLNFKENKMYDMRPLRKLKISIIEMTIVETSNWASND